MYMDIAARINFAKSLKVEDAIFLLCFNLQALGLLQAQLLGFLEKTSYPRTSITGPQKIKNPQIFY